MVELSSSTHAYLDGTEGRAAELPQITCIADKADALEALGAVPEDWVHSGYQSPRLLAHWIEHGEHEPFILRFETGQGPVLLPLEKHDDCTARYVGGRHANGNFPLGSRSAIASLVGLDAASLRKALRGLPHSMCSLVLERQLCAVDGLANPFVTAHSTRSPNVALSFAIADGFDAVLKERNGKRLRKKMRSSQRKLEDLGTVEVVAPETPDLAVEILDRFFALKTKRFKELGIFDVFADEPTRRVLRALYANAAIQDAETGHQLHALCVNGAAIAVIGCTIFGKRVTVEFGAFDNDYAAASPGDLLFFRAIEHYCNAQFDIFDFGVGDELYKRRWCDVETWHADTFIAANMRGQLIAITRDLRSNAVRMVKSNDFVWAQVKRLRRLTGTLR